MLIINLFRLKMTSTMKSNISFFRCFFLISSVTLSTLPVHLDILHIYKINTILLVVYNLPSSGRFWRKSPSYCHLLILLRVVPLLILMKQWLVSEMSRPVLRWLSEDDIWYTKYHVTYTVKSIPHYRTSGANTTQSYPTRCSDVRTIYKAT
jgi:hypothetical protein